VKRFLLDTNIVSDVVRNPQGNVARRLAKVGTSNICTSIIVAAELRYGAEKRGAAALTAQLNAVLGRLEIVPFEAPTDTTYALLRTELERSGKLIGANDLLIAAHALALGCVIVTDNEKEFLRVPNLEHENWLR
jgi:tRNA(fMet)-specific endonuclease VapC